MQEQLAVAGRDPLGSVDCEGLETVEAHSIGDERDLNATFVVGFSSERVSRQGIGELCGRANQDRSVDPERLDQPRPESLGDDSRWLVRGQQQVAAVQVGRHVAPAKVSRDLAKGGHRDANSPDVDPAEKCHVPRH